MRKLVLPALLVLPLAVAGGLVFAKSASRGEQPPPQQQESAKDYVCPVLCAISSHSNAENRRENEGSEQ